MAWSREFQASMQSDPAEAQAVKPILMTIWVKRKQDCFLLAQKTVLFFRSMAKLLLPPSALSAIFAIYFCSW